MENEDFNIPNEDDEHNTFHIDAPADDKPNEFQIDAPSSDENNAEEDDQMDIADFLGEFGDLVEDAPQEDEEQTSAPKIPTLGGSGGAPAPFKAHVETPKNEDVKDEESEQEEASEEDDNFEELVKELDEVKPDDSDENAEIQVEETDETPSELEKEPEDTSLLADGLIKMGNNPRKIEPVKQPPLPEKPKAENEEEYLADGLIQMTRKRPESEKIQKTLAQEAEEKESDGKVKPSILEGLIMAATKKHREKDKPEAKEEQDDVNVYSIESEDLNERIEITADEEQESVHAADIPVAGNESEQDLSLNGDENVVEGKLIPDDIMQDLSTMDDNTTESEETLDDNSQEEVLEEPSSEEVLSEDIGCEPLVEDNAEPHTEDTAEQNEDETVSDIDIPQADIEEELPPVEDVVTETEETLDEVLTEETLPESVEEEVAIDEAVEEPSAEQSEVETTTDIDISLEETMQDIPPVEDVTAETENSLDEVSTAEEIVAEEPDEQVLPDEATEQTEAEPVIDSELSQNNEAEELPPLDIAPDIEESAEEIHAAAESAAEVVSESDSVVNSDIQENQDDEAVQKVLQDIETTVVQLPQTDDKVSPPAVVHQSEKSLTLKEEFVRVMFTTENNIVTGNLLVPDSISTENLTKENIMYQILNSEHKFVAIKDCNIMDKDNTEFEPEKVPFYALSLDIVQSCRIIHGERKGKKKKSENK